TRGRQAPTWKDYEWKSMTPFLVIHALGIGGAVAGIVMGAPLSAWLLAGALFWARMFGVTAGYHRYFSHRTFKTGRVMQFLFAFLAMSSAQRGALWWAAHHRQHHANSDAPDDPHSPNVSGFWYSHCGWFLTHASFRLRREQISDLVKYPELLWLERADWLPFVAFGAGCFALGSFLEAHFPQTQTNGWQLFVWGFCISTVALYHCTYTINSLAHRFGRRRYATADHSRNNAWLAMLTLGEGWHNNHHHYPGSARQGFYWWEIDITFYLLRVLRHLGLISELKTIPPALREARRERA
ncbi:MAG: acyl-CoA desaturase, partial [Gammaproteobacteria bacterium]|nr:acyl-CoA desaturase [Gammaproteobacteria bacterium]